MLKIHTYSLGPVVTNAYLVADLDTKDCVIIDPAWNGDYLLEQVLKNGYSIKALWITHAHFDHIGGVAEIIENAGDDLPVALHPLDLPLWSIKGGASMFGITMQGNLPKPQIMLTHGQKIQLGNYLFEVRHVPGHSPGHVVFYEPVHGILFCGDTVFKGSIGRTDLPGGDYRTFIKNIREQLLTLPDETRLLPGHGEETTIGVERLTNPYLV